MTTTTHPVDDLRRQWRRQILAHRDPRTVAARMGFVALSIIDQASTSSVFVDIANLLVVLLYEGEFHSNDRRTPPMPLRLSGYKLRRMPHGVQWGGAASSVLFKDLMLMPQHGARGQRIDRSKVDLLSLALKLDRRLSLASRHPAAPWPGLRLPRLWAGFPPHYLRDLRGNGPEFEQACRRECVAASALFHDSARHTDGLTLYPLDWTSGQLESASMIFAELRPALRRQIFRIAGLPEGLIGYQGASAFDFYNCGFRRLPGNRSRSKFKRPFPQKSTAETELLQTCSFVA